MISDSDSIRASQTQGLPTDTVHAQAQWAIQTEHLTKIYAQRLIAVNDMALEVPKGSVFGLLGPNGAGKTTTLRLLLGLQRPTGGWARVFGIPCGPNAVGVRRMIGYLPTNPKLPGHLRPIEYLDLLGKLCHLPHAVRKPRISSLLRTVGLLGATNQLIRTFSTGMCTRLGIAASLVGDPPLLIWDEPTAGLDPSARRFTLDLISELGKTKTVIIATHILNDIDQICDHLGIMQEGRMIYTGSIKDLKQRLGLDEFCLELDGSLAAIERVTQETMALGLQTRCQDARTLYVRLTDDQTRASVLARVLALIESQGVRLDAIHSSQNTTENAYLQLLQEDQSHGFDR
ncbi:MAG: ABC transporter ATP-binding protein [Phycisphaerae bacterium]|nr:ABC transporter ATP-binding protein [Phycisphaerae bacterium]